MPPHPKPHRPAAPDSQASDLAISALSFIAGDEERLSRFLALTGIDPTSIRARIGDPLFQLAIIDHLFEDESLLLAFCADMTMDPNRLVQIRQRMKPHADEGLREG